MDINWNVQVEYFVLSCGGCGWISLDNSAHVCHWYCREIQEEQVKDAAIVVVALLDRKWTWWLRPWSRSMWHIANCILQSLIAYDLHIEQYCNSGNNSSGTVTSMFAFCRLYYSFSNHFSSCTYTMDTFPKHLTQWALQTHTSAYQLTFGAKCTTTTTPQSILP